MRTPTARTTDTPNGEDVGTPPPSGPTELTLRALDRISVSAPYFAFDDLTSPSDGVITATMAPSAPLLPEVGAVDASQVARHLAILGSCAAALTNPSDQRHHYLAVGATYARLGDPPTRPVADPMSVQATAHWVDKRTATASMTLAGPAGKRLNRLDVTYAVMKPNMFRRLNPPVETTHQASDPSASGRGERTLIERARGIVMADCGPVTEAMCAGHFPGHPAAPVAVVMGQLVRTARDALCSHLGTEVAYRVEAGTVEANRLAQPGQRLTMEAEHRSSEPDGTHLLDGRALADGEQVGSVSVRLAPIAAV